LVGALDGEPFDSVGKLSVIVPIAFPSARCGSFPDGLLRVSVRVTEVFIETAKIKGPISMS